jgi:hypothetical protein
VTVYQRKACGKNAKKRAIDIALSALNLLDCVASAHTDPLGNRTVLLLSLAQDTLGLE